MSQDMEAILRKSLDDVDRSQKRQMFGLVIFLLLFLIHAFAFIDTIHHGDFSAPVSREAIARGVLLLVFTVGFCTFGVTLFMSRMTKRILRAINLLSRP
jgi:hypothetical protein